MGLGNRPRRRLAVMGNPARPQPIGRVQNRRILAGDHLSAFARRAAQHGIDQPLEMHRLRVGLRQPIGGVDRRVRRDAKKQKLARAGNQDLQRRTALVRRRRFKERKMSGISGTNWPKRRRLVVAMARAKAASRGESLAAVRASAAAASKGHFLRSTSARISTAALRAA